MCFEAEVVRNDEEAVGMFNIYRHVSIIEILE